MSGRTSGDDVSLSLPGLTRQSISLAPRYPDQPYYDGVAGDIAKAGLKAVPVPVVTPAPIVVPTPTPVVVQPLAAPYARLRRHQLRRQYRRYRSMWVPT